MDVISLLEKDHRAVDELFRRFHLSEKAETQEELGREIVRELSVHAAVEEQFVYPLLRFKADDGAELADHGIEEHAEVKQLLADLEGMAPGSAAYRKTMEKVIESVRHHVEDEEHETFPKLRSSTDAELRRNVGQIAEQAKLLAPTHPHPLVPGTATAQLVAGPWVAVVDKMRDVLGARSG